MYGLRFSIFSECSCDCCDRCSFSSSSSKVVLTENCMFSNSFVTHTGSLTSGEAFTFSQQTMSNIRTAVKARGVSMVTTNIHEVSLCFLVLHAPDVHIPLLPQHCPVEQSSSVLHSGAVCVLLHTLFPEQIFTWRAFFIVFTRNSKTRCTAHI